MPRRTQWTYFFKRTTRRTAALLAARPWNDQKCRALLACSRSRRVSHVFSFEKKAASFAGNRIFHLVKMNCHVCLTDAYNEISVGTFQRGNVGNERRANPLTHFYAATFILYMVPRKLCLPASVMNCLMAPALFSSGACPPSVSLHSKGALCGEGLPPRHVRWRWVWGKKLQFNPCRLITISHT